MPSTVAANNMTVVHKSSNGVTIAFPDVCKTPSPAGPIPIPYPNVAMSTNTAKGSKKVKVDGNPIMLKDSNFSTSTGDEAGSAGGGVVSSKIKGKAEFVNYSFDVMVEGKNVGRLLDLMLHNDKNTPPSPLLQPPLVSLSMPVCPLCTSDHDPKEYKNESERGDVTKDLEKLKRNAGGG